MVNWPIQLRIVGAVTVDEGTSSQYAAFLDFDDDTTQDVTNLVTWSTSSPFVSISNTGLATFSNVTGNRNVTVVAALEHADAGYMASSIAISIRDTDIPLVLYSITIEGPKNADKNSTGTYQVRALYTNGTSALITPTTFTSNRPTLATINVQGQAQFLNVRGTTDVRFTATYVLNGVTRQDSIDIIIVDTSVYPVYAYILGPDVLIEGTCADYKMFVVFEDDSKQQVVPAWMVEGPATINCDGRLKANKVTGVESVGLVASYSYEDLVLSADKSISITDISISVVGMSIEGPDTIREGLTTAYSAALHFSDGSSVPIDALLKSDSTAVVVHSNTLTALPVDDTEEVLLKADYKAYSTVKMVSVIKSPSPVEMIELVCADTIDSGSVSPIKVRALFEDGTVAIVNASLSVSHPGCFIKNGNLYATSVAETIGIEITATYEMHGTYTASKIVMLKGRTPAISRMWIEFPDKVSTPTAVRCKARFDDGVVAEVDAYIALPSGEQVHLFQPMQRTLLTAIYKNSVAYKEVLP